MNEFFWGLVLGYLEKIDKFSLGEGCDVLGFWKMVSDVLLKAPLYNTITYIDRVFVGMGDIFEFIFFVGLDATGYNSVVTSTMNIQFETNN